ncbi:hypothetical protein HDU91_003179, partial [Kappamyces sp. JEL0680]
MSRKRPIDSVAIPSKKIKRLGNKAWLDVLDQHIAAKNMVELHTHLLGMGSNEFWVQRIMCTYLVRVKEHAATDKWKELAVLLSYQLLVEDTAVRNNVKAFQSNLKANVLSTGLLLVDKPLETFLKAAGNRSRMAHVFESLLTFDVVYGKDKLEQSLGLDTQEDCESPANLVDLGERLAACYHDHIIYNARKRTFTKVHGITNSQLVELLPSNKLLEARINNAFAMLNEEGEPPESPDLDKYRGRFSPEFYPKRFQLKDCIYEQRLEVLGILINNISARYAKSGVYYVELSLGVKDLLNQDVWKHILKHSFATEIELKPIQKKASPKKSSSTEP